MSDQQTPPGHQPQIDYARWLEEQNRRAAERAHDKIDEFHRYVNEAAIKSGELTLRMAILINGGAAVALLTFVGSLQKEQKLAVANTLVWFGSGVALAALGLGATYLTHYFSAEASRSLSRVWTHPYTEPGPATPRYTASKFIFHITALLLGVASIAAFVYGMVEVRNAFAHL